MRRTLAACVGFSGYWHQCIAFDMHSLLCAYFTLIYSSSPMNVNMNINSLLVNYYSAARVSNPKGVRIWEKGKVTCSHMFSFLAITLFSDRTANPNCGH